MNSAQYNSQYRPVEINNILLNKIAYQPVRGNPIGNDPMTKATCFTPPCYTPAAAGPKFPCNGCWKTISFVVRPINGGQARFLGWECRACTNSNTFRRSSIF